MSLSVLVRASSTAGSRASRRKYGDLTRAASTSACICRGVSSDASSGSSQGSHSSCCLVKATGAWCGGGCRIVSGMVEFLRGGGQDAQAGDDPDLIGEERHELRERDDAGRGPAGLEQSTERL